jgi:hypothetical protein
MEDWITTTAAGAALGLSRFGVCALVRKGVLSAAVDMSGRYWLDPEQVARLARDGWPWRRSWHRVLSVQEYRFRSAERRLVRRPPPADKTHCRNGLHRFDEVGRAFDGRCRACYRDAERRKRQRRREAA